MCSSDSKESISPEAALLEFVQLLEREIRDAQALDARLAKVFCCPGEAVGVNLAVPQSYTADLCKADLRRRQGLASINAAMRRLHRTLESVAEPMGRKRSLSKEMPSRRLSKEMPSRPKTVPAPGDRYTVSLWRQAANPIGDMTEAQHLLGALRRIVAATPSPAVPGGEAELRLPGLLRRALEGSHRGPVDVELYAQSELTAH
jgi:hypothetical protein